MQIVSKTSYFSLIEGIIRQETLTTPMRRLLLTLLASLIVVPAAYAAARAQGDGVFELKAVYGTVQIGTNTQPARGVLWGQMDSGKMRVVDPVPGDGAILVSGAENRTYGLTPDGLRVTIYSGRDLHFRVTGCKYNLVFNGSGIDLTAVGVGVAYLDGDDNAVDAGYYAVNSGDWAPMPTYRLKPVPVPFSDQSAQTP